MSFKVRLKDVCPKSLERRVQEKLNSGYILQKEITPVQSDRKEYSWRNERGNHKSYTEGSQIFTNYYAVVVKQ